MNDILIISFTNKGATLANKILEILKENKELKVKGYGIEKYINNTKLLPINNLKTLIKSFFEKGNIIIFIGSLGIAVRSIAPFVEDKINDAGVIVIDELGSFVIPILSGHIGRANYYAKYISKLINALPVLTTATDINNIFSIDNFAVENNYFIKNPKAIKYISSSLLNNQEVGLFSDFEIKTALPKNIILNKYCDENIFIKNSLDYDKKNNLYDKNLFLIPKQFHLGVGVKKNASSEEFNNFILKSLEEKQIPISLVGSISSIDLKKNEKAIISFARKHNINFKTYSNIELNKVSYLFKQSMFVKKITGVGNVCDSSAYLASNKGKIILNKVSFEGMTLSITKEIWNVVFI